jgi:hypothetical protein
MVVGKGGGDAGVDGLLRLCYDLDEDVHKYHVMKVLTPAQAKIERAKLLRERNKAVFNGGADKPIFRVVRVGGRKRVVMMRRKMNWRPSGGNKHRHKSEKRIFSDNLLMDADVRSKDL